MARLHGAAHAAVGYLKCLYLGSFISAILQTALNVKGFPHLPVSFIRRLQVYIEFWVQVVSKKISFSPQSYCRMFSRDNDRRKTLIHFRYDLSSAVWFFLREVNRFLDIFSSFAYSRKSCFSILETRYSRLETRSSIVSSIEAQGSSLEVRVSSVNLLLSGTVAIITSIITHVTQWYWWK